MTGTIPLERIGDVRILTSDLVKSFKSPDVLNGLTTDQLQSVHGSIIAELERRSRANAA